MSATGATVEDLAAEQHVLQQLVGRLTPDEWLTPTPARGWDVRDTIAHLADTDEMACDTITGGPRAVNVVANRSASSDDVTFQGVLRGRRGSGADTLTWWKRAAASELQLFAELDPETRVAWGIGMKATSFVSARLMETWAHSLDVGAAVGVEPVDTDRLAHVAWLATRALPYAYSVAGREAPPGALRVELTLPSGATFTNGPDDAPNRIVGPAGQYCRVFVQRLRHTHAADLRAEGDAAVAALEVARAYL